MVDAVLMSSDYSKWATPKPFYNKLDREFHFTFDACAEPQTAKCGQYFTAEDDGLAQDWEDMGHWLLPEGVRCLCTCHQYIPRPPRSNTAPGMAPPAGWARPCANCRECELTAAVGFMNPPYGDPEDPCKDNCKNKRCIGAGHEKACPDDCTDKKHVGRGHHATEYTPGIADFMRQAFLASCKGATMVALVPNRSCAEWYHGWVLGKADEVRQVKGRLRFEMPGSKGDSAPFPSIVVVYRPIVKATRLIPMGRD